MYVGLHVTYPLFLSHFNEVLIFQTNFFKNTQISNFTKIIPVQAKLFHVGRQADKTDMMKLTATFCKFVNAPKKCTQHK